jgi:DNA-directed RNA polymerase specialized sigma24 family protein
MAAVRTSLTGWKKATKGNCPPGREWDDIEQDAYVAILEAPAHDPARGTVGPRVNAIVKRVFLDACRDKPREVTNLLGDAEDHRSFDPPAPDETSWPVDASDYLAALSPEDAAVVNRVRGDGLSKRDSATRRRESRVIQRLKGNL